MLAKLLEAIEAKGKLDPWNSRRSTVCFISVFHWIVTLQPCLTLLKSPVSRTIYSIQVIRFATLPV